MLIVPEDTVAASSVYCFKNRVDKFWYTHTGIARNLLRGTKQAVWGSGVQGQSPGGGLGRSPQKPETNANFQLRRGACTHVPLGHATIYART